MHVFRQTILLYVPVLSCLVLPAVAAELNTLSDQEKQAGFELLFNGRDFQGWEQPGNWVVDDGAMFRSKKGGNITYTVRPIPDDFELCFDWKVAEGSNSGVYYRPGQYEYQILDNQAHADGLNPRSSAASLYFCMAPSKDATKPVGEWNTGRIVCKGTVIQHWLNGEKVIDFDYSDPRWAENVELLRRRGANLADRGAKLFLQDHGDPVWFRNIKLRRLTEKDRLDRSEVVPQPIAQDILQKEKAKLEKIEQNRQRKAKR